MNAIIAIALRHRVLVLAAFMAMLVGGLAAFAQLNIEAYPDPTPPMVDIITQSPGLSAEEIERYVTIPIETQTSGLPNLRSVRTISLYGLSDVKLQFTFDYTYDQALQQVLNRLATMPQLPNNVQPQISPLSPIGEIFRYKLVGPPSYSLIDLKTLQDWVLQRRFRAVPGVIDVTGWGGKTKTYELEVDFNKLIAFGLTLPQVLQALAASNINVGGNTVNIGPQAAVVRGVGLIRSIDDLGNTMLTQSGGNPVLVKDVASVTVGYKPRLGIAGKDDDDDIVQGIVLMRRGEQSTPTITRVLQEVERINSSGILPPGVRLERIYDRKELINVTTRTVLHNMAVGIALIFVLQWVFLGNVRSAVIVGATIPFALFFAVSIMVIRGESANLLSVGAIDFGLIVDATVIMVESIFRWLSGAGQRMATERAVETVPPPGLHGKLLSIFHAASDVNRSIFFAAAIIIAGFIPLFTLSGVEGHIFGPMAKTYAYALAGGLIATFTVAPALSAVILPEHVRETETVVMRVLHHLYTPTLRWSIANRRKVVAAAGVLFLLALVAVRFLGLEFLPKLEEGNLWIRATLPSTISLEEGNQYVNRMRAVIRSFPEVESVVSQHGRPDDGTDAAGFFNAEFFAPLKPADQWPPGIDKDDLTAEILEAIARGLPRRRVQLLAIFAGQRGGGGLRRQRRELDQAVRQRPAGADRYGSQDQAGAVDGPGRHRSRGLHVARPTDGADRRRPGACRPLWSFARRHQLDHSGRDRRRQRRRVVRARQRSPFPDRRAARAAIPAIAGGDPESAHRCAGPQRRHANSLGRGGDGAARVRCGLHLSRAAGALPADQVQRARA